VIAKGPSIYPEKAEVSVAIAAAPQAGQIAEITAAFSAETGFRLVVSSPTAQTESAQPSQPVNVIEIPVNRIRLTRSQQALDLDAVKIEKAIERARLMGITPPIQVRRAVDGYILTDGLFRLRAAQALGLERISAIVE
jgi:hypothetical protein